MENPPDETAKTTILSTIKSAGTRLKKSLPFGAGILAALVALLAYRLAFPAREPISAAQLQDVIAEAMASATPPPPFASRVYDTIKYSLVLIETSASTEGEDPDLGIGSGVVIDFNGDILTSLHVVSASDDIWVTYADGTRTPAAIIFEQPENDIAVLQPLESTAVVPPAILGVLIAWATLTVFEFRRRVERDLAESASSG